MYLLVEEVYLDKHTPHESTVIRLALGENQPGADSRTWHVASDNDGLLLSSTTDLRSLLVVLLSSQ